MIKMLFHTQSSLKFAFSRELEELDNESSNIRFAIIGIPFDSTSTYKTGSRFGPIAIREASYNFEKYNMVLGKNLDVELFDFGDIEVIPGNFKKTCSKIESTVSELQKENFTPLVIGGEHTVSYGVLKALKPENITFIHFDAHMDLRDEYMGEKNSHATAVRRIFHSNPLKIIQIGVRSCSREEIEFAQDNDISYFTSYEIQEDIERIKKVIKDIEGQIYVSVDIDVLDPAYAPSVGTPYPCGLNPFQMETLIHALKGKDVIGFDLVEVASNQFGDITSINAAKIIYDFLCTY